MEGEIGKAVIGVDLARGPDYSVVDGEVITNPLWEEIQG